MQGFIIKFLLFFFIAAFAASAVVAYRYWGLHESDERGLLRYQIDLFPKFLPAGSRVLSIMNAS